MGAELKCLLEGVDGRSGSVSMSQDAGGCANRTREPTEQERKEVGSGMRVGFQL